jgi:hypothetical protein
MARILLIPTEFPAVRSEPVIETTQSTPWYNDLSHDITDSTVFRCLLIIVVFDHIWKWMNG